MKRTSIVTVTNQKGGVGKTTTAVNLAAVYAAMEKKVLVVDLDHQCNATMLFGVEDRAEKEKKHLCVAFNDDLTLGDVVLPTAVENIDIVAAHRSLEVEKEKWNSHPKRFKLLEVMLECEKLSEYDLVLIDTHPSFDCYTQSALVSSHYYLIPLFAEEFSIRGLGHMISSVEQIRKYHNDTLNFLGCVITKFDKTMRTHDDFQNHIRTVGADSGFRVFETVIPVSKAIAGAEASHLPLTLYKPDLPVSMAYTALAGEILPNLTGRRTGRPKQQRVPDSVFSESSAGLEAGVDL